MNSRPTQSKFLSQKSKLKKNARNIVYWQNIWPGTSKTCVITLALPKRRETIDILIYHVPAVAESHAF